MTQASGTGGIVAAGGGPTPSMAARSTELPTAPRPRDAADVADAVAQAATRRQGLRIVGRGAWLTAGRPIDPPSTLDLSGLSGVIEYIPGDLTLTALAGTTLSQIAEVTGPHGQWLSLDPFGSLGGSLGATLATASTGPLGASLGLPRDVALGVEFVSGEGERIRGGGRVVKNVAGFDLVRLQLGAWGTLGVITEATVRLRGRPEVDRTVVLPLPPDAAGQERLLRALRQMHGLPLATELLNGTLAEALGVAIGACVLVRLAGNEHSVAAQLRTLDACGDTAGAPATVWASLATAHTDASTVVRLSGPVPACAATWRRALACAGARTAAVHASVDRGIARVMTDGEPADSAQVVGAALASGPVVVERAAPLAWSLVPAAAADRLSVNLRRAFDPHGILNPGILGDAGE